MKTATGGLGGLKWSHREARPPTGGLADAGGGVLVVCGGLLRWWSVVAGDHVVVVCVVFAGKTAGNFHKAPAHPRTQSGNSRFCSRPRRKKERKKKVRANTRKNQKPKTKKTPRKKHKGTKKDEKKTTLKFLLTREIKPLASKKNTQFPFPPAGKRGMKPNKFPLCPDAGWVLASVGVYMHKNADWASSR